MAKRTRAAGPIAAGAAYAAATPLARFRDSELHQRLDRKPSDREDLHWYFGPLADGRMRIIGFQAPRRLDDAPILLPVEMVARAVAPEFHKIAGPALLSLLTPWPSAGKRPDWSVESPTRAAEREARDRARREEVIPPKAIDWRRGQIEIDGMVFTECRVILAKELAKFPAAKGSPQRISPPRGKAPKDAREQLQEMIKAVPNASALKAREVAEQILAAHAEVMHTDAEQNLVNPDGWWTWGTLERHVSYYKD